MEWSRNQICRLIKLYRDRDLLWDSSHELYNDKSSKNDAWSEIAEALYTDRSEVKKKMKILIGQFHREERKERGSAIEMFESRWYAYNLLKFLKDKVKRRNTLEGFEDDSMLLVEDPIQNDRLNDSSLPESEMIPINAPVLKKRKSEAYDSPDSQETIQRHQVSIQQINSQQMNSHQANQLNNHQGNSHQASNNPLVTSHQASSHQSHNQISSSSINSSQVNTRPMTIHQVADEHDAYGITVATKFRKMNDDQRLYAEHIMNEVMYKAILNQLTPESCLMSPNHHYEPNFHRSSRQRTDSRRMSPESLYFPIVEQKVDVSSNEFS